MGRRLRQDDNKIPNPEEQTEKITFQFHLDPVNT